MTASLIGKMAPSPIPIHDRGHHHRRQPFSWGVDHSYLPVSTYRRGDVQELHLETPVAVPAGAFQAKGGVEHVTHLELARQLAVIEEDSFNWKAVEGFEASAPVLAFGAQLATLGQAQVLRREGRVLKAGAERRQPFERTSKVVADRLRLQVPIDPQNRFELFGRHALADRQLKAF